MNATVSWKGISISCRVMDSFFSHVKGLMFSRRLRKDKGVLFVFPDDRQRDIHMLFVFFALDVVWLDHNGKVLKIAREVKPFTPFVQGTVARYWLEVDAGVAEKLHVGDRLTINLKRSDIS